MKLKSPIQRVWTTVFDGYNIILHPERIRLTFPPAKTSSVRLSHYILITTKALDKKVNHQSVLGQVPYQNCYSFLTLDVQSDEFSCLIFQDKKNPAKGSTFTQWTLQS